MRQFKYAFREGGKFSRFFICSLQLFLEQQTDMKS